jgi:hypothetical protein
MSKQGVQANGTNETPERRDWSLRRAMDIGPPEVPLLHNQEHTTMRLRGCAVRGREATAKAEYSIHWVKA